MNLKKRLRFDQIVDIIQEKVAASEGKQAELAKKQSKRSGLKALSEDKRKR